MRNRVNWRKLNLSEAKLSKKCFFINGISRHFLKIELL